MSICVLCRDKIEPHGFDAPEGLGVIVDFNPETLRKATMHESCYKVVWEDSKGTPSTDERFESRQEQILQMIQNNEDGL